MGELNRLLVVLDQLNISKVELANYLKVSRQMVYNYLSMESFSDWPLKKRIKILELLEIKNLDELDDFEVNSELLTNIAVKLDITDDLDVLESYKGLNSNYKRIVNDVIRLCEDETTRDSVNVLLSLIEQSMISTDYKYLIMYLSKVFEKSNPNELGDDAETQMAFEGILYSAFTLYNSKKYSKDKTTKAYNQFVNELEEKRKGDSQITNTINVTKFLAINELGIDKIDESNIDQVLEKILEIQGRKL